MMASCGGRLIPVFAQTITMHRGRPNWQKVYRMHPGTSVLLNNADMTPGAVRTGNTADVCSGESTKDFRKTTAEMKAAVYKAYGVDKSKVLPGDPTAGDPKPPLFEIDHLISLELGGADDVKNLWPQPYYEHPGAHEKDAVENWLHKQVCAGKIELPAAQKEIADDWYTVYLQMQKAQKDAEMLKREPRWIEAEYGGYWKCPDGYRVPEVTYTGWRCEPDRPGGM